MQFDCRHPARTMPFADLYAGLQDAKAKGLVTQRVDPTGDLELYVYSNRCVYEDGWNSITLLARGLIIDTYNETVVATPFPKFFNLGEKHGFVPDRPFEAYEKLDGSLIIAFSHGGQWKTATKGAFNSEQARWAHVQLARANFDALSAGTTYLFEAIYPENRIVVHYDEPAMVLLGAYDPEGHELSYDQILETCSALGWRAAKRHAFNSIADMVSHTATLSANDEGFVVRFADGFRLKLKGAEYRRIHALISRCTPLAMWEAIAAGDDMEAIRRELPEEFWTDFDRIVALLQQKITDIETRVAETAAGVAHLSDKEVGLSLKTYPEDVRSFLFGYRKDGAIVGRQRDSLMRAIRPTGNLLPGYQPSYAMNRVMDDAA